MLLVEETNVAIEGGQMYLPFSMHAPPSRRTVWRSASILFVLFLFAGCTDEAVERRPQVAPVSAALGIANWHAVAASPRPSPSVLVTYVPSRERVLLLQGYTYPGVLKWEWDGSYWSGLPVIPINGHINHPELSDGVIAYDIRRERVVLYQSASDYSSFYELDGSTWTRLDVPLPPSRQSGALAYDGASEKVVLFGGVYPVLQDTWEWDGIVWTQVQTSGAAPAPGGRMAYDSLRRKLVMIAADGTWEFSASTWTKQTSTMTPPLSSGAAMVYDSTRDRMVLLSYGTTWEWDGADWSARSEATPAILNTYNIAFDAARSKVVLFTGTNETWDWDGTNWTLRVRVPPPMQQHSMAYDEARGETVLYGQGETWLWNGTRWEQRVVTPNPGEGGRMVYDRVRERIMLLAGDFWEWDGTTWTQLVGSGANGPGGGHMVYDSRRKVIVVFSTDVGDMGISSSATWEWNGSDWTRRTSSNQPPACGDCGIAYDSLRRQTVVMGHFGGAPYTATATWLWDGIDWTLAPTLQNPVGQTLPGMAYDAARDRIVSVARWRDYGGGYEWTGDASTSWLAAASPAPPRDWTAMAYDTRRKVLVVYGGRYAPLASLNVTLHDTWETVAQGTSCSSTADCSSGACVDGVCCDTQESSCGECRACNVPGSVGTCAPTPGIYCDDGVACTTSICRGDVCVSTATVCETESECLTAGTCDPALDRCIWELAADRTPCGFGNGQCREGACVNRCIPETCVPTECFMPEICDAFEGCVGRNAEDGTPCTDDRLLTQGRCVNGMCMAGEPSPGAEEGMPWVDAGSGVPDASAPDASIEDGGLELPDASPAMDAGSAGSPGGDARPKHYPKPRLGRHSRCVVSEPGPASAPDNSGWTLVIAAMMLMLRLRSRRG